MEAAAAASSSSGLPPPEMMTVPSSPRGQKRGAPDEDEVAGDGAARGLPWRAAVAEEEEESSMEESADDEEEEESSMEEFADDDEEEEEDDDDDDVDDDDEPQVFDARPARQLLDYLPVHPCTSDAGGAAASSSTTARRARQEPVVDLTLRLGGGPLACDEDDDTVDTTLSLRLGPAAPPPAAAAAPEPAAGLSEDGSRVLQLRGQAAITAMQGAAAAAADAEPAESDDGGGVEIACRVVLAGPSDQQLLPRFLDVDDYTIDCSAAATADVGPDDGSAAGRRRPSSSVVMDMNKPCTSGSPDDVDGEPDPTTRVPDPAAAVDGIDSDELAAYVDERLAASPPPYIGLFRSPVLPLFMMSEHHRAP